MKGTGLIDICCNAYHNSFVTFNQFTAFEGKPRKKKFVCRYNVGGFVQSYPDLREPRTAHACASFGNEASHFDLMLRLSLLHDLQSSFLSLLVEKKQIWIPFSCL